jgi:hypothetical protein
MKLRSLFTTLAICAAGLTFTPVHAQGSDPCSVYTCMAGLSGYGFGGPACSASYTTFFEIVIFDPYFDPGATAAERRTFMMTCPGAQIATNATIMEQIIDTYMWTP